MSKVNNKKIAIIGGGIGGLTLGYKLSKLKNKVTVFEREKKTGGMLSTFKLESEEIEKLYHHIFKTDKEIIGLIKELRLSKKLKWYKSSAAIFSGNRFYPFLDAVDLLSFDRLNLVDKIRLGLVYLWLKYDKNWKRYENISATDWMIKWAGKKAYKTIWEPLLIGKFHHYYKEISMSWLWARIHTRGASKNQKGEEVLGYLDGGFGQIIDNLSKKVKVVYREIKKAEDLSKDFDLVIDTRPVKSVNYLGAINLVFSSSQNLSKYYWHNINDKKSPFVVLIQHDNLLKDKRYQEKHVYYLGAYLPHNHKYFKDSDEKIEKEFFSYLKKIIKNFNINEISQKKVFRFKYAQHIVTKNYKAADYKLSKNKYRLSFAQVYPGDRGINFAVKEADKLIKIMQDDHNKKSGK